MKQLFPDIRERLDDLKCDKCGSRDVSVARNMVATRFCKCGNSWIPRNNRDAARLLKAVDFLVDHMMRDKFSAEDQGKKYEVEMFEARLDQLKELSEGK